MSICRVISCVVGRGCLLWPVHSLSKTVLTLLYSLQPKMEKLYTVSKNKTGSWLWLRSRCPFHYRGLECKSRKSRDTWSNRQIWPWSTEWCRAKANIEFCQENILIIANILFQHTREDSTHGHSQMVNSEIRLVIFFAARDGEVLYSQQKQDQEWIVAQIMNSLLPNSDLNWRKWGKPLNHSGMPKSNPLWIYSGREK